MINILGDGILGVPVRATPAADIPGGSLLETAAGQYPSSLLRAYVQNIPTGMVINEDGSFSGSGELEYWLYVDGEYSGSFPYPQLNPGGFAAVNFAVALSNIEKYFQDKKNAILEEEEQQKQKLINEENQRQSERAKIDARLAELNDISEQLKQDYNNKYNQKIYNNSLIPFTK